MFIQWIIRMQRIVAIQSYSWSIRIKKIIIDLEHRSAVADISSGRSKSCIHNFIVHAFETLYLIIQRSIGNSIRIKKVRQYSFHNKIRMTLKFIDQSWQFIFLDTFPIHTGIEE